MALSDLVVFNEYAYETMSELLNQQIDLFNTASRGAISLNNTAHQGDFSESAYYARISGLVRRRNVYGSGAVAEKKLANILDTSVKVAAGTAPIRIDRSWFTWIQKDPKEAGVVIGKQLAEGALADMLNTGLGSCNAALSGVAAVNYKAEFTSDATMSFRNLNKGQALFGDRASDIVAWVMHSKCLFDLYDKNLANMENLFNYGTVNIKADPFGKLILITDSPSLFYPAQDGQGATVTAYSTLGLTSGGLIVGKNNDFDANEEVKNGQENIVRTYQAEWTYNVGIQGFAWDKASGGHSPTDSALLTSTNWKRNVSSHKDLAGVVVTTL